MENEEMQNLNLDCVLEHWDRILKRCRTKMGGQRVAVLLRNSTLVGLKGQTLLIRTGSTFEYEHLSQPKLTEILQWAILTETTILFRIEFIDPNIGHLDAHVIDEINEILKRLEF
jgi:hypothetical protein